MNPDSPQPAAPAPVAPEPQPVVTPPQSSEPTPAPVVTGGKKMSKNVLLVIILAVVVVLAAVAYGVYAYVSNTPDNLMKSAVENLKNEKSMAATFKVVSGTAENGVTVSGDLAVTEDPSSKTKGEAIIGIGTGDKRVSVSALSLESTLYLKFANMENFGSLLSTFMANSPELASPEFAAALKNVNNQWFELTKEDVQSLAQTGGNDSLAGAVSPDDITKTLDIYNQHPFVKADKTYADETVAGATAAHFSLKTDKNEMVAFLTALKAANLETIKVTDADITEAKNAADTSADVAIEVWIARDSKKFSQIRLTGTKKGEEMAITVTRAGALPTFDKLEKPADTKPLSEFMTLLLGPAYAAQLNALESEAGNLSY